MQVYRTTQMEFLTRFQDIQKEDDEIEIIEEYAQGEDSRGGSPAN